MFSEISLPVPSQRMTRFFGAGLGSVLVTLKVLAPVPRGVLRICKTPK